MNPIIDELSIMIDYTASTKSIPDIARDNNVSIATVGELASRFGWRRQNTNVPDVLPSKKYMDGYTDGVIESLEVIAAAVSKRQRMRVSRGIEKGERLEDQLDYLIERIDSEGESLRTVQLANLISDATSIYKSLVDTSKTNISLERLVYGLADNANGDAPQRELTMEVRIDSVIDKINARRAQLEQNGITTH